MATTVFAVTSGKGGVGKTTTAINLAAALDDDDTPTVVVDADLGMPNVGAFLDLAPETTLHDVLDGDAEIDAAITAAAAGFDVVAGAPDLERFADADPDAVGPVIESLRERYRYVVVDTGGGLSYESVSPIEHADAAVLVTTPAPAAIADATKSARLAARFGVPVAGVVVTHSTETTRPEEIADELGVGLLGSVAFDPRVRETDGSPVVAVDPDSQPAAAYRRVAESLVEAHRTDAEAESDLEEGNDERDERTIDESAGERSDPTPNDDADEPDSEAVSDSEPASAPEPNDDPDDGAAGEPGDAATAGDPESDPDPDGSPSERDPTSPDTDGEPSSDDDSGESNRGVFGRLFGWLR